MVTYNYLNGEQLAMFIPARELMNYTAGDAETTGLDYRPMSESPNVRARKLRESKEGYPYGGYKDNLYENIKKEGVKHPVQIRLHSKRRGGGTQIWDGQHRLVSAHDIDPNMEVPVHYSVDERKGA